MLKKMFGRSSAAAGAASQPQFVYPSRTLEEAREAIEAIALDGRGTVLLSGASGLGKTLLLQLLAGDLERAKPRCRVIALSCNFGFTGGDLVRRICEKLGARHPASAVLDEDAPLRRALGEALDRAQPTIILVDEAQNLGTRELDRFLRLTDLRGGPGMVLAGRPEAEIAFARASREHPDREFLRFRLQPLPPDQIEPFIAAWLRANGRRRRKPFSPEAVERIARHSGGVPGIIAELCAAALLLAADGGRRPLSAEAIEDAVDYLQLDRDEPDLADEPPRAAPDVSDDMPEDISEDAGEGASEEAEAPAIILPPPASPGRPAADAWDDDRVVLPFAPEQSRPERTPHPLVARARAASGRREDGRQPDEIEDADREVDRPVPARVTARKAVVPIEPVREPVWEPIRQEPVREEPVGEKRVREERVRQERPGPRLSAASEWEDGFVAGPRPAYVRGRSRRRRGGIVLGGIAAAAVLAGILALLPLIWAELTGQTAWEVATATLDLGPPPQAGGDAGEDGSAIPVARDERIGEPAPVPRNAEAPGERALAAAPAAADPAPAPMAAEPPPLPGTPLRPAEPAPSAEPEVATAEPAAPESERQPERQSEPRPQPVSEPAEAVAAADAEAPAEAGQVAALPREDAEPVNPPASPSPSPPSAAEAPAESGPAESNPAAPESAEPEAQRIAALLERAERQIASYALTTPAGDNAFDTYQQVLALAPGHPEAQQGIRNIAEAYLQLATVVEQRGDAARAGQYRQKAAEIAPDHPAVVALRQQRAEPAVANAQPASPEPPAGSAAPATEQAGEPKSAAAQRAAGSGIISILQERFARQQPAPESPTRPRRLTAAEPAGEAAEPTPTSEPISEPISKPTGPIPLWAFDRPGGVETAVRQGRNVNTRYPDGRTPVIVAAARGESERVGLLLANGAEPNAATADDGTALMYAAWNGDVASAKALLENGASPDARNIDGKTALMAGATNGHMGVLRTLLEQGASPNERAKNGWTALMYAAWGGNEDAARVLLDHGADPTIVNREGDTAAELAARQGYAAIADMLSVRQVMNRLGALGITKSDRRAPYRLQPENGSATFGQ